MLNFILMVANFFNQIFDILNNAVFRYSLGSNVGVSVGSVLFAALVIGFVVSLFWKGARSQ